MHNAVLLWTVDRMMSEAVSEATMYHETHLARGAANREGLYSSRSACGSSFSSRCGDLGSGSGCSYVRWIVSEGSFFYVYTSCVLCVVANEVLYCGLQVFKMS